MLNCILCLNLLRENNSVRVTDFQDGSTTVADIIKKHFWFSEVSLKKSSENMINIPRFCFITDNFWKMLL